MVGLRDFLVLFPDFSRAYFYLMYYYTVMNMHIISVM